MRVLGLSWVLVLATCDDQSVCEGGSCLWVPELYGWRCRWPENGGLYYGLACEPGNIFQPCPAGGFCRDNWGDPSLPEDGCFPGALSAGTCAVLGAHADFCDSTWPDEQCYPCNHLSDCIDGRCLASCSAAGDCPCEPGDPYECHQGHCKQCRSEGEPCAPPLEDCCGEKSLECYADLGVCCRGAGAACSVDADCCQTALQPYACKEGGLSYLQEGRQALREQPRLLHRSAGVRRSGRPGQPLPAEV
jgi:hypothetical protein